MLQSGSIPARYTQQEEEEAARSLLNRVREGYTAVQQKIKAVFLYAFVLTMASGAIPAMAQSDSIEIDMAPFFTNMNTYIPIFFGIFAIVGGIMAAMALSKLIINAVVGALSGRGSF